MYRFFSIDKWSKLDKSLEQKPNILLSQFSIIAVIGALIQFLNDVFNLNAWAAGIDSIIVITFISTFLLNENKRHLLAKFIFIVLGTGLLFIFAAIVPKSIGVYLVFFPFLAIIFLIFSNEERQYKYYSAIYIICSLLILELTSYQPFGSINILEGKSDFTSYYLNMLVSVSAMIFSMYNVDVINNQIDKVRLDTLKELEKKNNELELANNELDHFVYSASHDLKAPLSSILGLINIAKYDVKDHTVIDYFVRIENRVERLTHFIKEVIEISRNTRTDINTEPIILDEMLDEIIENNNYIDGMQQIEFKKNINFTAPILSDKARLEVILNNLISNAIKYSDPRKKRCMVDITADKIENVFRITVEDNGIGIADDEQEKVFEMFYRGAQGKEGSGLGLYILKNMLLKLNGEFTLNSKEGKGTKIEISFPIPSGQS